MPARQRRQSGAPTHASMHAFYGSIGGTLPGPAGPEAGVTVHRLEALHPQSDYESPRFRTAYYSLVIMETGRGAFFVEDHAFETGDRTVYFTNPGHLKGFRSDAPPTGTLVTWTEGFLRRHLRGDVLTQFPWLVAEIAAPLRLDVTDFAGVGALAAALLDAYHGDDPARLAITGHLLVALLHRVGTHAAAAGAWREQGDVPSRIVTRFRADLAAQLRELVAGRTRRPPTVGALADAQQLSAPYLGTVVRRRTGRTAHAWIADALVAEARAMLAVPGATVREVADRLAFAEPNHLSRFFRRETGETPRAYQQREARRATP